MIGALLQEIIVPNDIKYYQSDKNVYNYSTVFFKNYRRYT